MTHQTESNVLEQVLKLLTENGFEGYAQVLELILNQAMLIERSQALGAEPYQRSESLQWQRCAIWLCQMPLRQMGMVLMIISGH